MDPVDYNSMEYGPAFAGGAPGSMAPPPRPGTFDADMARGMTPPPPRDMTGPGSPGIDDLGHDGPFGDEMFDEMQRERADEPPVPLGMHDHVRTPSPPPREEYWDPAREDAAEFPAHLMGERPGLNTSESLAGAHTIAGGWGDAAAES
ncbi:hypothetical protein LTR53_012883 [Teratosphaeriaceae sp. CCFEE 6253]|nr:hypothetical protein LTR53_012883 [Teratosphaeriaceae sp. CCFEE 6253]